MLREDWKKYESIKAFTRPEWSVLIDRTKLNIEPFILELPLFGHKCFAQNCNEIVIIGGPFCKIHTFIFYHVEIKQTTLIGFEFYGLFACKDFVIGEKIVPYPHLCQFNKSRQCNVLIPDSYSIQLGNTTHSALQYRGIGSLANTVFKKQRVDDLNQRIATSDPKKCNCKISRERNFLILMTTKNIFNGEEIFLDYGKKRYEFLDIQIHTKILRG